MNKWTEALEKTLQAMPEPERDAMRHSLQSASRRQSDAQALLRLFESIWANNPLEQPEPTAGTRPDTKKPNTVTSADL